MQCLKEHVYQCSNSKLEHSFHLVQLVLVKQCHSPLCHTPPSTPLSDMPPPHPPPPTPPATAYRLISVLYQTGHWPLSTQILNIGHMNRIIIDYESMDSFFFFVFILFVFLFFLFLTMDSFLHSEFYLRISISVNSAWQILISQCILIYDTRWQLVFDSWCSDNYSNSVTSTCTIRLLMTFIFDWSVESVLLF